MVNKEDLKFKGDYGSCSYCKNQTQITVLKENEGFCSEDCLQAEEKLNKEFGWIEEYE
jgi:hypothetical protein